MTSHSRRAAAATVAAALAAVGLGTVTATPAAAADVATVYGLTSTATGDAVVTFSTTTPGTLSSPRPVVGLLAGERLVGIDVRPATGELYGVTSSSRLVTLSTAGATATATPVGGVFSSTLQGTAFGVDFNPRVDALRVVSDSGQNLRINPTTVAVSVDSQIAGVAPTGAAYSNNSSPAVPSPTDSQTTTLFDIDTQGDQLVRQDPPNSGGIVVVGPLGVGDVTGVNGFDIAGNDSTTGFAALQTAGATTSSLYRVALASGTASKVADFPAGTVLRGLAVASAGRLGFSSATSAVTEGTNAVTVTVTRTAGSEGTVTVDYATASGTAVSGTDFTATSGTLSFAAGETSKSFTVPVLDDAFLEGDEAFTVTLSNRTGGAGTAPSGNTATVTVNDDESGNLYGVTTDNRLVEFTTNDPGTAARPARPITGLASGEQVLGLDFRPATGTLYALTSGSRLYVVDRNTGRATPAPAGQLSPALNGEAFGVDFNPVPDRLRIVSDNDQNLRVNVDTATAGTTAVDGTLAYTPDDAAAGINPRVTAVAYSNNVAGATTTSLFGLDTGRDVLVRFDSANAGTLRTVGALGVDVSDVNGFDIATPVLSGGAPGAAFAALVPAGATTSTLYKVDLTTGALSSQGAVLGGVTLRGLTFAPPSDPRPADPEPAAVAVALQTKQITAGNNPNVIATVTDSSGTPVASTSVVLLAKRYRETSYTQVGTAVRTGDDGRAVFNVRPDRQTAYIARAANGVQSRAIVQFVYARINVASPAPGTTVGRTVVFRGNTVPNYGRGVAIGLGLLKNGRFSVLTQAPTDAAGNYVITARNLPRGTGAYVVFTSARNGTLKGAKSLTLTVR